MSLPLLLERRTQGNGPKVPIRDAFDVLVVEGLTAGCQVKMDDGSQQVVVQANGRFPIAKTIPGLSAQATLEGPGSCVHVWLEKSNG
jgi:hypothetical protein